MPSHPLPTNVPYVDEDRCRICRECAARQVCRVKAVIILDPGEPPFIDGSRCYGCMVCVPACPFAAIVP